MTATEDKPTIGERYTSATGSSNLRLHNERRGDADFLIAAGLLPDSLGAMLFRLCAEYDMVRGDYSIAILELHRQIAAAKIERDAELAQRIRVNATNAAETARLLILSPVDFDAICDRINRGRKTAPIGDSNGWTERLAFYKRRQEGTRGVGVILDRSFAIAAGIAMLLATGIAMHQAVRASNLEAQLERERTGYAVALVDAVNRARADERDQAATLQENSRAAQIQLTRQRDDAFSAGAAVGRLRSRAAAFAATACAAQDPAPADGSPAAPDPATVLADVLGRLAQAGGELAAIADLRGTAGATCQLDYAAVAATAASAAGN